MELLLKSEGGGVLWAEGGRAVGWRWRGSESEQRM